MKSKTPPVWVFFSFILLGLWLIAVSATFPFQNTPLLVSDLICAFLLIILGFYGRVHPSSSLLWTITVIGIWLQFTPLVFWASESASYLNNTLVGTLVIVFAVVLFPLPSQTPDEEPTIPPGWTYNPSSWPQRLPIAFLAFICWMISRYLAAYQLGYIDSVWDPFFTPGTKGVLESSVSHAFPVSDAGLGSLAYTLEFLATCQGGKARWRTSPWGVFLFGILAVPVSLVSVILIILQPLVVGTWCSLCLATAICMLLPIPLAIDEVIASWQYLKQRKGGSFLSLFFRGGSCSHAKTDERTPHLDAPLLSLYKASLWGVTFPWNLVLSAFCGIFLMSYPSLFHLKGLLFNLDPILGALIAVVSVLSFAECLRRARWINLVLCLILLGVTTAEFQSPLSHYLIAIFVALLSIRKGPINEKSEYKI